MVSKIKGRQRYKCKRCNYRYTVKIKSTAKSKDIKRQALELYLEGLGFRSIARFLQVSHVAVYNWIKAFGEQIEAIKSDTPIEIVELDEMHTYIAHKKTTVGYGLLLIDMGKGLSTAYWATEAQKQGENYGN
jgi:transposase-like protein